METADATAIHDAAARFAERVLVNPLLACHWAGREEARVRRYARRFLLQAVGGPEQALGDPDDLRAVALDDAAYDEIQRLLEASLREAAVSDAVVDLARVRAEALRADLVTA